MGIKPSHRLQTVKSSSLVALRARAAELARSGHHVIDLSRATLGPLADDALPGDAPRTASPCDDEAGLAELRAAICTRFERDNDLRFPPAQVLVSHDARHAVHVLLQALLNEDDEVVLPAPYPHAAPDLVRLAGGEPVIVRTAARDGWRITPEQLRGALGPRSRLLWLAGLGGTSGALYPRGELEMLAAVLVAHPEVALLCDDLQEPFAWGASPYTNLLNAAPRLHERCVVLNAVPGGIAYMAGAAGLIAAMSRYQSHSVGGPSAARQMLALTAFAVLPAARAASHMTLRRQHDLLMDNLGGLPGLTVRAAAGGRHVLADLRQVIAARDDVEDDAALARCLLDDTGVACAPGLAFGAPGHLRLSFAVPEVALREGLQRLRAALS